MTITMRSKNIKMIKIANWLSRMACMDRRGMSWPNMDLLLLKCSQIFAHLDGGMDCVTASYAGVAGSSPTEKEQKFVPSSFDHNLPRYSSGLGNF